MCKINLLKQKNTIQIKQFFVYKNSEINMIFTKTKQPHVYRYIHRETYKATVLNTKKTKTQYSGYTGQCQGKVVWLVPMLSLMSLFQPCTAGSNIFALLRVTRTLDIFVIGERFLHLYVCVFIQLWAIANPIKLCVIHCSSILIFVTSRGGLLNVPTRLRPRSHRPQGPRTEEVVQLHPYPRGLALQVA